MTWAVVGRASWGTEPDPGIGPDDPQFRPDPLDGANVLRLIKVGCPPGTVPRGLTAEAIEEILKTATLGRGGGNTKAKRHTNVLVAVEALIDLVRGGTREP